MSGGTFEAILGENVSATQAGVRWSGGKTVFAMNRTSTGTGKVQVMGPDGATWIDVPNLTATNADAFIEGDLPPGTYRLNVSSLTGVYAKLIRVPG